MVAGGRVFWILCVVCIGCAHSPQYGTRQQQHELRHVSINVFNAVALGDERRYRELVLLPPGDHYSDALTTTMFEAIRLHQAVEEQRLEHRDDASDAGSAATAGRSLASSRPSSLAVVDYRDNAKAMVDAAAGWTFTISGDRATINELAGSASAPSLRKLRGRWVLAPTGWDTRRDTATYRLAVVEERSLAKTLATARAAVLNGTAASIEDVNAILRDLLTEPTTQP